MVLPLRQKRGGDGPVSSYPAAGSRCAGDACGPGAGGGAGGPGWPGCPQGERRPKELSSSQRWFVSDVQVVKKLVLQESRVHLQLKLLGTLQE